MSRIRLSAAYIIGFVTGQVTGFGSGAKAVQSDIRLSRHIGIRGEEMLLRWDLHLIEKPLPPWNRPGDALKR